MSESTQAPALAIFMSTYNCAAYVAAAVQSILSQDYKAYRFYIVDDASRDGTGEILTDLAIVDARIVLHHNYERRGLTANLNFLMENTAEPLIARMDGDDLSLPGRLAGQIAYLQDHPEVHVLGTWTRTIAADDRWLFSNCYPNDGEWIASQLRSGINVFTHGSIMLRRSVIAELGRPIYRTPVAQDYDLWLRLVDRANFALLPQEGYCYRQHLASITSRRARAVNQQRAYLLQLYARQREGQVAPPIAEIHATFDEIERTAQAVSEQSSGAVVRDTMEEVKDLIATSQRRAALRVIQQTDHLTLRQRLFLGLMALAPSTLFTTWRRRYQLMRDPLARYRYYPQPGPPKQAL